MYLKGYKYNTSNVYYEKVFYSNKLSYNKLNNKLSYHQNATVCKLQCILGTRTYMRLSVNILEYMGLYGKVWDLGIHFNQNCISYRFW